MLDETNKLHVSHSDRRSLIEEFQTLIYLFIYSIVTIKEEIRFEL